MAHLRTERGLFGLWRTDATACRNHGSSRCAPDPRVSGAPASRWRMGAGIGPGTHEHPVDGRIESRVDAIRMLERCEDLVARECGEVNRSIFDLRYGARNQFEPSPRSSGSRRMPSRRACGVPVSRSSGVSAGSETASSRPRTRTSDACEIRSQVPVREIGRAHV